MEYTLRVIAITRSLKVASLNPYSNGIYSTSYFILLDTRISSVDVVSECRFAEEIIVECKVRE